MQALVSGKSGPLDRLDYDCPDGKSRETYFDYSDDPDEKAMLEQLKQRANEEKGTEKEKGKKEKRK